MVNSQEYETELNKLTEIFAEIESDKKGLINGLIHDAAFLYAENKQLRELINETGTVRVHPTQKELQKPSQAAQQYLKNVNTYAVVIKTLNTVLSKNFIEDDDEFDKWVSAKKAALDE